MFNFLFKSKKSAMDITAVDGIKQQQGLLQQPNFPSSQPQSANNNPLHAPGTTISYDPNLIPKLVDDHRLLLNLYGNIVAAKKDKNSALIKIKLDEFSSALNSHLLIENIKFYVYLQRVVSMDQYNSKIVSEFRQEMQQIGKAVMDFLQKYRLTDHWNESVYQSFDEELDAIGKTLGKRIQAEENTLYTLYLPPHNYE